MSTQALELLLLVLGLLRKADADPDTPTHNTVSPELRGPQWGTDMQLELGLSGQGGASHGEELVDRH